MLGSLHILYEDGKEFLTQQSNETYARWTPDGGVVADLRVGTFSCHKRNNSHTWWIKVRKEEEITSSFTYGNPFYEGTGLYGGGLNIIEPNIPRPRTYTAPTVDRDILASGSGFAGVVSTTVNAHMRSQQEQLYRRQQAADLHARHVEEHRIAVSEMARRSQQREDEARRLANEETRPRRPWDRFRRMFD